MPSAWGGGSAVQKGALLSLPLPGGLVLARGPYSLGQKTEAQAGSAVKPGLLQHSGWQTGPGPQHEELQHEELLGLVWLHPGASHSYPWAPTEPQLEVSVVLCPAGWQGHSPALSRAACVSHSLPWPAARARWRLKRALTLRLRRADAGLNQSANVCMSRSTCTPRGARRH